VNFGYVSLVCSFPGRCKRVEVLLELHKCDVSLRNVSTVIRHQLMKQISHKMRSFERTNKNSKLSFMRIKDTTGLKKKTRWSESVSELYRQSERHMSAKLVPTFADTGCRVVSSMDPHGRILGFLGRSRYFFFQVVSQLYSRGRVDPVPDPLLLTKSGSPGNRTRTSRSAARSYD
jgi:hypothetical protein